MVHDHVINLVFCSPSIDGEDDDDTRRLSHNEIERRRRDNQRDRLEDLRRVLPNMRDSKQSMVATIIRAREYIVQLQTRVADLERMVSMGTVHQQHQPQHQLHQPQQQQQQPMLAAQPFGYYPNVPLAQYLARQQMQPVQKRMPAGPVQVFDQDHPNGLPSLAPKPHFPITPMPSPIPAYTGVDAGSDGEEDSQLKPFKRGRHGSSALFTAPDLTAVTTQRKSPPSATLRISEADPVHPAVFAFANAVAGIPTSTLTADDSSPNSLRRDSSLLLPTADPNLYLFGHRDSMQNLFAAPLPFIMEQQKDRNAEIQCGKCRAGINSLIMIDCDICHTWYHIRCINLDPEKIPVHWTCSNCPRHPIN